MRRALRATSVALILSAVALFGYVAYELWGTGLQYANSQDDLAADFEAEVARSRDEASTVDSTATAPTPGFAIGDAFARLRIPTLGPGDHRRGGSGCG